jgi:hypothetical protein
MKTIITFILSLLAGTTFAWAQTISAVKGNRVLLTSITSDVQVGDRFVARNAKGKAKALVEVKQVKESKAVAMILKGRLTTDLTLTPYKGKSQSASFKAKGVSNHSWGVLAGFSMDSMTAKPGTTSNISLSGTSFDLSGYYQMPIDGNFGARVLLGYETFEASGTASTPYCDDDVDCSIKIAYLGLQGLMTYSFLEAESISMWAGVGLGFLFALSKESDVIKASSITTSQTIVASVGLDYKFSPTMIIPVQVEYALFPDTNTASANQINIRFGVGFGF